MKKIERFNQISTDTMFHVFVRVEDLDRLERYIEQLESEIRSAMGNYNIICKSRNCEHFIEWECEIDKDCQPYPCTSCRLVGQSYDISELAKDCPFGQDVVEEIKGMKGCLGKE